MTAISNTVAPQIPTVKYPTCSAHRLTTLWSLHFRTCAMGCRVMLSPLLQVLTYTNKLPNSTYTIRRVLYLNLIPSWYQVHVHLVESRRPFCVKIMSALSAGLPPSMLRITLPQQQAQMASGTTAPQMEQAASSWISTVERTTVSQSSLYSEAAGVTRVHLCY